MKLNKTRTITFGFMAAPAKPQPTSQNSANTGPVPARANWPPGLRVTKSGEQSSLDLIANSAYWGTAGNDNGFYPWNKNCEQLGVGLRASLL